VVAVALALGCSTGASIASAQTRAGPDPALRAAVETYYDCEDLYNGVYVGLGSANAAAGIALATREDAGLRGAGIAITSVGGIQLLSGILYLALSPGWRKEAMSRLARDEADFLAHERERVASVESMFVYYKLAEATAVVTGLVLGSVGAARDNPSLMGAGAGLGASASLQLTMEHITHDVAKAYLFTLERRF
jgi:hypothetical protein